MSRLHVISASTRPVSAGRPLAGWIAELARERVGFEVTLVDLLEVGLPFLDEPEHPAKGLYTHSHTKAWSATIDAADAFVFVMPMYNGGFTAPLKNAIDFLHAEWQDKPVGLISYSAGPSGGAPAVEMIKPVLGRVGLRPAERTLSIPGVADLIGPDQDFRPTPGLAAEAGAVLDSVTALLDAPRQATAA